MARKRPDDEELEHEEPEEVVELDDDLQDADEDIADIEDADLDDADADLEDADAPLDDADAPAEVDPLDLDEPPLDDAALPEPEAEEEPVEPPLRARTSMLTMVLLVLNVLAVPPFLLLTFMDYAARQQWSYATLVNRVYPLGLPLEDDENAASMSSQPRLRLDADKLKEAYTKRKPAGTPSVPEPFQPVDTTEESIRAALKPSQIDDAVKADLFKGLGPGVSTLEEEVRRLKKEVPEKIEEAAKKYVAGLGSAEKKKAAAEKLLLALAWSTQNVEDLKSKIDASDPKLDELVKEAALRHMLVELLAPLNVYRPAAVENFEVEKVVELKDGEFVYSLAKLNELLGQRFDEAIAPQHLAVFQRGDTKRDDIEKRHAIGFLLFSVSRLKAPESTAPLLANSLERAQVVSGLYEFAQAAANYVRTLHVLESRMLYAIAADRGGYLVFDKADPSKVLTRTNSFMDEHAADIQRLKFVAAEVRFTKNRLEHLEEQRKLYKVQFDKRAELLAEVTNRLVESRGETRKILDDIQRLEQDIFVAQKKLSDAAERNARLELQIVQSEQLLLKGGKK
jgi:hypothetical protein